MFISLSSSYAGNACAVKQSIDNYYKKNETQFFDWLVYSIKSVNEILEKKPILFEDTYIYPNNLNTTSINFLHFDLLISHHDIDKFNDNSIVEITEKYNRRYERLINTIKTEKEIFFIRYCKNQNNIEDTEIIKFFNNIININNNLLFKFILISDCDNLIIPNNLKNTKNFIYIDLNNYIDDDIINETDLYKKTIKKYKCVYNIINQDTNSNIINQTNSNIINQTNSNIINQTNSNIIN